MSSGPSPIPWSSCESQPCGERITCQPIVRTRKLVQNGTSTSAIRMPFMFAGAFTAIQYATGAPITKQIAVPAMPIHSVFRNVSKNVGVSASR